MDKKITKMDELILSGAMEVDSLSSSGDFLYRFTDKLKDLEPDIYKNIIKQMYQQVLYLWEIGFISMDVSQENPVITLTPKAYDQKSIDALPDFTRANLFFIIKSIEEHS